MPEFRCQAAVVASKVPAFSSVASYGKIGIVFAQEDVVDGVAVVIAEADTFLDARGEVPRGSPIVTDEIAAILAQRDADRVTVVVLAKMTVETGVCAQTVS